MKKTLFATSIAVALAAAAPSLAQENATPDIAADLVAGGGTPPPEQAPVDGVTPRADEPRQPVTSGDTNFFLRQAMLTREIRLLELQARKKELQDEIAGKKDDDAGPAGIVPGGPIIPVNASPAPAAPVPAEVAPPPPPPLPFTLLSIYGGEGAYRADFAVGAARVSLSQGGELPGGWAVRSIGPFEVVVRKGGQNKTLRLGS